MIHPMNTLGPVIVKTKLLFVVSFLCMPWILNSQPNINVEVSADTIEMGQPVEVKYTIQNGDGKFQMPALDSLPIISGPNSSSSFLYQNGEQSYSQTYSFILLGTTEGKIIVPGTRYTSKTGVIEIDPLEITVVASGTGLSASGKKSIKESSKTKREKRVF